MANGRSTSLVGGALHPGMSLTNINLLHFGKYLFKCNAPECQPRIAGVKRLSYSYDITEYDIRGFN